MTANDQPKLGAILLAAGGSTRLGRPKQLIKIEGETLLRLAARKLAESVFNPVVVVLGAEAGECRTEIETLPVRNVVNPDWKTGLGSSIRVGVENLVKIESGIDGAIIVLCDQPAISTADLNEFAARFAATRPPIIAAAYNGVAGVPALFSKTLFHRLSGLQGDQGARRIIRETSETVTIDLPAGAVDIDLPSDLERL